MVKLANTIAEFQPVVMGVLPELMDLAKENYSFHENVTLFPVAYNDCWARDTVSSIAVGEESYISAFHFNAYGAGLYAPWDDDEVLDESFSKLFGYPIKQSPLTLEGGNILPDGAGTLFAVRDTVVNPNRNPGMSEREATELLKEATCSEQIVWIPEGLVLDETGGHIDNMLVMPDPHTILMAYTDDPEHPQYGVTQRTDALLREIRNVKGEPYRIVHVPMPPLYYRDGEDSDTIEKAEDSFSREAGDAVLESYINVALVNGAVIVPQFGLATDKEALAIFEREFPDRKIIPVYAREATLGGGGFHCLTKHIN
jgi:agmatine deiminase